MVNSSNPELAKNWGRMHLPKSRSNRLPGIAQLSALVDIQARFSLTSS
jgi:hypothetical protein